MIPPGITLCFSGSTLGTVPIVSPQGTKLSIERSNYAARAPHETLVRARCQAVIPSAVSKNEVTIDCYSEKRSRPSPWSGSAPTGARAWGGPPVAVQETRQKSFFSSRKFGLYQHALAALEHASILSTFNSLAAWERKRIRFNGDISTVRFISTTEHRIARATLERARARAMNELLNWRLSLRFCFRVAKLYTKLKKQYSTANYSTALTTYH